MREINKKAFVRIWDHALHGLGTKLIALLLGSMVVTLAVLGYLTIRLQRQQLEATTLLSAERMSDVIRRGTTEYMLRNDRDGLHQLMSTIADEPGMIRVRVLDREGLISYSTDPSEINHTLDKSAEACDACHARGQAPPAQLNRTDRFRVYRGTAGRVLAIITPIENQPDCSNAACHEHAASQRVLGVLDTHLSLTRTDQQLEQLSWRIVVCDLLAIAAITFLSWLFILRVVDRPLKQLQAGTQKLSAGALGYQIHMHSKDEIGDLAESFNSMSMQLQNANQQLIEWGHNLEGRVEEKTNELRRAHDQVLHSETMASVGKMAAVVAHEINNPLSGILTYSKLIKKWVDNGQVGNEKKHEAGQCLDLISSESRRCGDLVKNLLSFSRQAPMNVQSTDVNLLVEQCLHLVAHNLENAGIEVHSALSRQLPRLKCDPSQIEQVLLAVIVNAADAMSNGGNLWLSSQLSDDRDHVDLAIRDDGCGIPADILPKVFEPFVTTKDLHHGTGLGLAVSRGIVEGHAGKIFIQSEVGKGTTVTIRLPAASQANVTPELSLAGADVTTR
jgi:two-component system, NtrC family, sensor kinase